MAVSSCWCTKRSCLHMHIILIGILLSCMRAIPFCRGDDSMFLDGSCIESERRALLAIKADIYDPDQWLSSWEGQDCCRWRGVGCDNTSTRHVVKLDLRYPYDFVAQQEIDAFEKFPGPSKVNPSLLDLMHLKYLDLSLNNFSGAPIPKFIGSLVHLEYLNLSYTDFGGSIPPELGNLSSLYSLDLHWDFYFLSIYHNSYYNILLLHADDLHWLSRIHSLQFLDMSLVNLSKAANWLHEINMLPSLLELHLSYTNLPSISGTPSHVNLTSLRVLDLSQNHHISITVSCFLSNVSSSLVHLNLGVCYFHDMQLNVLRDLCNLQHLDLYGNQITREIFQNMGNLSLLEYLDLSGNQITADTSEVLAKLGRIKYLDMSFNNISGAIPKSIGNLHSLVELHLSENHISGEIPESIENLVHLQRLYLYGNMISGEIPRSIRNLCKLNELDISQNNINGEIAYIIEGWSQCIKNKQATNSSLYGLRYLFLEDNNLSGTVPESLSQISTLQGLSLSSNSFTGHLTEAHFTNLRRLQILDLSYNSFEVILNHDWNPPFNARWISMCSCHLGPKFPTWLRTQTNLKGLQLSENGISDDFPSWFWDLPINGLNVSHNSMTGKLPTSLRGHLYHFIDLSSNKFHGLLPELDPSFLRVINLSNNSFEGPILWSLDRAMELRYLLLSNNHINGSIHPFICNLTSLVVLDLSNNNMSGRLSDCWHKSKLWMVDSQQGNMPGHSQGSVAGPIYLQSLHLRNNSFSGDLPLFLRHCTQLDILDLSENNFSGNLPLWIGESLVSLRVLSLRSNFFDGNIPKQLSNLTSLQVLDLACNYFSGVLPPSFGKFRAMMAVQNVDRPMISENYSTFYKEGLLMTTKGLQIEYTTVLLLVISIDLSCNNLSGMIPEQLMNLGGLRFLNLSNNHFRGSIPENFGALKQLESLDLSVNNLSGMIPLTMSSMYSLDHLNLSSNNLSGSVPWGYQLQTFCDPSIYSGNPYLRGWPLPWCSPKSPFQTKGQKEEYEHEDEFERIWLYLSIALGFIVGLFGFIYALMIKQTTRNAYFQLIDWIFDYIYVQVAIRFAKLKLMLRNNIKG